MKAKKQDNSRKVTKKTEKKALEQSLATKLFEAVKSLGHDAEQIGEDLILVSKFVAKKISKRVKSGKQEEVKGAKKQAKKASMSKPDEAAAEALPSVSPEPAPAIDTAVKRKTKAAGTPKRAESVLKKVASKPKATATSVKVNVDPFIEQPEDEPTKEEQTPAPVIKPVKSTRSAPKKAKPVADDKKHIN